jgi:phosphopantetheine--protein transferase-like protein
MRVGTDIVEVERFANKNKTFYQKIFTEKEILYSKKYKSYAERFAGIFCTKEAIMKALSVGIYEINPLNIEVLHLKTGKAFVNLTGNAEKILAKLSESNIEISISHIKSVATAVAIIY